MSGEKNTACTAIETAKNFHGVIVGPFRVWDLDRKELLVEINDAKAWTFRQQLHGDWLAIRSDDEMNFYHIPTSSKHCRIPPYHHCYVSAYGSHIAYSDGTIHVLELATKKTRDIQVPRDEEGASLKMDVCGLSDDGRLVAGQNNDSLLIFDVASGKVIKRHIFTDGRLAGFSFLSGGAFWKWAHGTINCMDL